MMSFLYLPWNRKTENHKNAGYHFGAQRSVGPCRRGLRALGKRSRVVS
jgi:hypothetical protein